MEEQESKYLEPEEIEELITDIKAGARTFTVEELVPKVAKLTTGLRMDCPSFHPGLTLYRGRKFTADRIPLNINELSFCPAACSTSYGRANVPGQSMFYVGMHINPLFFEIDAEVDDLVGIAHWQTTAPLLVNNVGYTEKVFGDSRRECPSWSKKNDSHEPEETNKLLQDFFSSLFMQKVLDQDDYRVTAAIAEFWLKNQMFSGLLYPSAAMNCNADNIAIKPSFVESSMTPLRAELARVSAVGEFSFDIEWLDSAAAFDADGFIQWKGHFDKWEVTEKGKILTLSVNDLGRWEAHDESGKLVPPV